MEVVLAMGIFSFLIGMVCFVLWIWALVDIIKSQFKDDVTKLIWFLVVFFLPFVGLLLYIFAGRSMKIQNLN